MFSVTALILHAFIVQGLAENPTDTSVDDLADMVMKKVADRLLEKLSVQSADLDGTTLGKTHPDQGLGAPLTGAQMRSVLPSAGSFRRPASSHFDASKYFDALPGDPAMKELVKKGIQLNNGCIQVRDFSAKASPVRAEAAAIEKTDEKEPASTLPKVLEPAAGYKLMATSAIAPLTAAQVKEMPGVTAPFSSVFDPFGISTKVPEGQLLFYREAELKHGRVCMLAFIGLLVAERHDFIPLLAGDAADVAPWKLGGPYISELPYGDFWPAASLALFAEEWRSESARKSKGADRIPGDYGYDPLGLKPKDAKGLKEMQNKELNNGRLAMLGAAGMIAQEMVTGKNVVFP